MRRASCSRPLAAVLTVAWMVLTLLAPPVAAQHVAPATAPTLAGMATHDIYYGAALVDQNEYRQGRRGSGIYAFEGLAYYGTDYDKLQVNLRAESNQASRGLERAEMQLLYSRLLGYFWDAQFGVRHDFRIDARDGTPGRSYAVAGIQGLAPGLFEVNIQAFLGERGVPLLRGEFSYDLLITNRLVLQPEIELDVAAGRDEAALIAPGLYRMEAGLRLRYEVTREFAPYIGVSYERAPGGAAGLNRKLGLNPEAATAVAGVRLFF